MKEVEAKFEFTCPEQVTRLLELLREDGWVLQEAETLRIVDRYFDTVDWRLFRAGWAYRWQEVAGRKKLSMKTLEKSPTAVQTRLEAERVVPAWPASLADLPAGELGDRLRDLLGEETPRELFQVSKNRRRYWLTRPGGTRIELAIDDAEITFPRPGEGGEGRSSFQEIELELYAGVPDAIHDLAVRIGDRLKLRRGELSKFERGLQASGRVPPGR